jgi:hypothetical protein
MKFRWDQVIPDEQPQVPPLPVWPFVVLFLIIECVALAITVLSWPKGVSIAPDKFLREALAIPFFIWLVLSALLYRAGYDSQAFAAAVTNGARWHLLRDWKWHSRVGVAILDSVILTPEPDLAVRMLELEGKPPENPGGVMALDEVAATEGVSRASALAEKLLAPLAPLIAKAIREDEFDIVVQCDREENTGEVQAAWERLELPKKPPIRWIPSSREIDFAEVWFKNGHRTRSFSSYSNDETPKYRLLLAWHLNDAEQDEPAKSEAAVALLVGSPTLMSEKNRPRPQAWLLRQIVGDADQVDKSLGLLLKAEQVPGDRIHHFWHSKLKGLAQHGTMGAVRDSGLTVATHELEQAVGPQAPVARWVLQALAAKMAHYGQGPQLIALPHERGVVLNFAAKEPSPVNVPWKDEYDVSLFPGAELIACVALWMLAVLASSNKEWGTFETLCTCGVVALIAIFFAFRFWEHRILVDDFWLKYGRQS